MYSLRRLRKVQSFLACVAMVLAEGLLVRLFYVAVVHLQLSQPDICTYPASIISGLSRHQVLKTYRTFTCEPLENLCTFPNEFLVRLHHLR